MVWWHSAHPEGEVPTPPADDPLLQTVATPSMKATRKYFFVVIGLILVQIAMGAITAHYAVEGRSFFGLPLAQLLPYTVSRSIHTQFGVFWIATAWLATGLYIAPLLAGHEPKWQKLGVDALFYALIVIVVGSTRTRRHSASSRGDAAARGGARRSASASRSSGARRLLA